MSTANIATLVAYDCWSLLEGAEIARVAWQGEDGIELIPVNYTVADGSLWFRTEADSSLARGTAGHEVVVEVDHVDLADHAGWSVVIRGGAELVDVLDVPDMLVDMRVWPTGAHTVFVRVEPDRVTGRRLWAARPNEGDA
ncbi:pyridoxamine 5'-phosphate oxidase family protein [Nocardioides sp.]|uniref:pyridoxamine 5'-phosphate oxidase family protein n=1 Tax=Nocardioides sp. TaxID=35761 RepID=UPI0037852B87